jgi:TonB family protein
MIEQTPMNEPEKKPDEAPKPKDEPPAPMGTNVAGNGPPDAFGLSGGSGSGGGGGGGGGTGGKGGSRWGWYAGEVQSAISNALRSNGKTRTASLSVKARIWADSSGRITRAQISGSTGNRALDDALLTGLQLQNPPPQDMPMPITLRINARKPN